MKRKGEAELAKSRPKRQLTSLEHLRSENVLAEAPEGDIDAVSIGDGRSSAASFVDSEAESDAESDVDSTPATTITRHYGARADDGASTTTKYRKIFPSMLKTLKCTHPGCEKTFNRPVRLAAHLRAHAGDRALKCPHEGCDKAYIHDKDLKQHIRGSHPGANGGGGAGAARRYACDVPGCDKAFLTATRLRRHAVVHTDVGRFTCKGYEGCDRVFRKRQTLQRHVRSDHLGQPAFGCTHEGCGHEGFDTANALKRHVDREHGQLRFWCEECGKDGASSSSSLSSLSGPQQRARAGFTTMARLMHHMRHAHVDCMFCDTKCGGQRELERHIEMHHSGSTATDRKVVPCTWEGCDKKFTRRANMQAHVKTAHEGFRFVCGEVDVSSTADLAAWWTGGDGRASSQACGADFISKQRLEDHIRVVHLKIEVPKPAKMIFLDDEGEAKPAGFFNMYASSSAALDGFEQAAGLQMPPHSEAEVMDSAPLDIPASVLPTQPSVPFCCSHVGCLQSFPSADELETHVSIFHVVQQELFSLADPSPNELAAWDSASQCGPVLSSTYGHDNTLETGPRLGDGTFFPSSGDAMMGDCSTHAYPPRQPSHDSLFGLVDPSLFLS